jgi:hypothetical protein
VSLVSSYQPWWYVLSVVIVFSDSLLRSKEAIYFVCAANRRALIGSSAQLPTIGLDASYIRNAVQTTIQLKIVTGLRASLLRSSVMRTSSKQALLILVG